MKKYRTVIEFWKNYVFKKYLLLWLFAIGLEVAHYIVRGFIPFYYKVLIDALVSKNLRELRGGIAIYIGLQILSLVALLLQRISRYKIEFKVWKDLNIAMNRRFHTISYGEVLKKPPGEIMQRIIDDLWKVLSLVAYAPSEFIGYSIFFIVILFLTGRLSSTLLIILLLYAIIYFIGYKYYYSKRITYLAEQRQKEYANYTRELEESLNNTYDIRLHRGLNGVMRRFNYVLDNYIKRSFDLQSLNIIYQGIFTNGLLALSTILILLSGVYLLLKGTLSVGTLVAFVSYIGYLYELMSFLTSLTAIVEPSIVSVNRVNEFLGMKEVYVVNTPKKIEWSNHYPYAIEVKDLDFFYGGIQVFNKLNLIIKRNTFTAICGESGIGKTTFLNLLLKFYDVPPGKIFICGQDINNLSLEEIFGTITCVEQEPKFFTGNIENNLKLFYENISNEKLRSLTKALGLEEKFEYFISKEGNVKLLDLSGGERKILGIIRGLLASDTPIWILDEPTSFLDKISARKVLNFLKQNSSERTIVILSHDSLVREYIDKIIEIKKST
jgi:ATP-binding cassette subfamily B protein/subfamily B ATP-binding cassette protein MsbA